MNRNKEAEHPSAGLDLDPSSLGASSSRKTLATQSTAGIDDLAARNSGHAGTETMAAGADDLARLKRTLHDEHSKERKNDEDRTTASPEEAFSIRAGVPRVNSRAGVCR
jgi:hypothetical protein